MKFVRHRVNLTDELLILPKHYGAEIDCRSDDSGRIILNHDPFLPGENLEFWLKNFEHGTLIVNVKEDGLEGRITAIMKEHQISDYFFLDQSIPSLVGKQPITQGRSAIRLSEYEPLNQVRLFQGICSWVWVDCFSGVPRAKDEIQLIADWGFKICLVSPELQGYSSELIIDEFASHYAPVANLINTVCTKYPDRWIYNA